MRKSRTSLALEGASKNAATAFDALQSEELAHVPQDEKAAWAMAAIVHCDMCRLLVALAECRTKGLARLLWMADITSKLFEAKNWYFGPGLTQLRTIASRRPCGATLVDQRMSALKASHPIGKIERFSTYRNKIGYHYDIDAVNHLASFGEEDAESFHALLVTFAGFSGAWAALCRDVLSGAPTLPNGASHSAAA